MGPARMYNSSLSSLCDNAICLHILYISYGYLKYRAHLTIIFDTNNVGVEEHSKNLYPYLILNDLWILFSSELSL